MFCATCRQAFVGQGRNRRRSSPPQIHEFGTATSTATSIVRKTIDSKQWERVKEAVIARDGPICQNHRRHGIMRAYSGQQLQLDHICPQEARPDRIWDLTNLEHLCVACHARKTTEESGLGSATRRTGAKPLRITWDFRPNLWVASGYLESERQIAAFKLGTGIKTVLFFHRNVQQLNKFLAELAENPSANQSAVPPNEFLANTLIICDRSVQFDLGQALLARFHQFMPGLNV